MIVLMEYATIYLALVLTGLCLGSYAGALVWRLRARQLVEDKAEGEQVDSKELKHLKKLTKTTMMKDRSQCLSCDYELRWYDLIPLYSWLSLGGKCRKCRKPIGMMELLIEVTMAAFFVASFIFWPGQMVSTLDIIRFIVWLLAGVGLAVMFIYDLKWFLLPNSVSFTVIGLGIINVILLLITSPDKWVVLAEAVGSILILSGIYWFIYEVSKGKWIGFGDIKLGLGLGLLLADWKLAFIALFAANLIGCLIVLPAMMLGKLKRDSHVPFGPLLITGFVIASFFGYFIIDNWYMALL